MCIFRLSSPESMNLSVFVAKKYFLSKKKNLFINIISLITVIVIALATMAFVILLSVFNGLEDIIRLQYNILNPEIKISPKKGKFFVYDENIKQKISKIKEIKVVSEAIEDDAVFRYKDRQMVGKIKGVTENYMALGGLSKQMRAGEFKLYEGDYARAVVGLGVFQMLTMNMGDEILEVWYPNRKEKIRMSEKDITKLAVLPAGIFEVEYEHDGKYILVPIEFTEELMSYSSQERSYLEIALQDKNSLNKVQAALKEALGDAFLVENQEEQQFEVLRAIRIEKLVTRIALSFVFLIACFNIFFLLTMITLEKKKDIAVWRVLGAEKTFIQRVFIQQGLLIALTGAVIGLLLGVVLCWLQQQYGFVKMGLVASVIDAYPVRMDWLDFVFTFLTILFCSILVAYFPAKKATKTEIKENL
jgi:lipoprotein-releasing system permease protein